MQVVSAGPLGVCPRADLLTFEISPCLLDQATGVMPLQVLGRNGWYCLQADVEQLPSLAGWRGLRDATIIELFNATLYVFASDWGPDAELLRFLKLPYQVVELGVPAAEAFLESRLEAGLPTLFYLWTPHIFHAKYRLNRIQLPEFSTRANFSEGKSDYPTEVNAMPRIFAIDWVWSSCKGVKGVMRSLKVLEKSGSRSLEQRAMPVQEFYRRFTINNAAQIAAAFRVGAEGVSIREAACDWLRAPENAKEWITWIPAPVCPVGMRLHTSSVNGSFCEKCPPGSASPGVRATACIKCAAGSRPFGRAQFASHEPSWEASTQMHLPALGSNPTPHACGREQMQSHAIMLRLPSIPWQYVLRHVLPQYWHIRM